MKDRKTKNEKRKKKKKADSVSKCNAIIYRLVS